MAVLWAAAKGSALPPGVSRSSDRNPSHS